MRARSALELIGGALLLLLGALFVVYIPHDPSDIVTDAFFLGAGVLLVRHAVVYRGGTAPTKDTRAEHSSNPSSKRNVNSAKAKNQQRPPQQPQKRKKGQ